MRIAWAFEASTAHQRHIFSSLVPAVLILLTVLPLSSGTSHAPTTASNICLSHKTCSSCILANVDCFWNISTQSCVYTGNIDIKLDYFYNSSKRHLPIENITLWLQNQSSAALGLQQCPDLQCSLINVSFSYLSCSPQGMLTFAAMVLFVIITLIFWIASLHFEVKASAQSRDSEFGLDPDISIRVSVAESVRKGLCASCLDCGIVVNDLPVIDGSLVPLCRFCRLVTVLDRHITVTTVFLPAIYVFWMIGGTYLAVYSGILFLTGSVSVTIHQCVEEKFWTDITPKEFLATIIQLIKKSNPIASEEATVNIEEVESPSPATRGLSEASNEILQTIKSATLGAALRERLSRMDCEVLWLFERHNMIQHPWTRTFRGMLGLAIGMIVSGFALSFVLLTRLPTYGPPAVAVTMAVLIMIALASPAVFFTREIMVITTKGILLATKRPFALAVCIGYIAREKALKCYISVRGFEANGINSIDVLKKPLTHRASLGFRIAPFQGLDIEDVYEVEKAKKILTAEPWNLIPVPDEELAPSSPPAAAVRQFLYAAPLLIAATFLIGGGTAVSSLARGVMWSSVPLLLGLSFAIWAVYSSSLVTLWLETGRSIPPEAPFKPPRLSRGESLIAMRA